MKKALLLAAAFAFTAGPAFAHVGIGSTASFAAGVAHPLIGADHLAVAVAVGLWAALKGGRATCLWPVTFVGVMLIGGVLGIAHVPLPYVEPAILASVVALGIVVALAVDPPTWVGALVLGAFAIFHGHAHGSEVVKTVSGVGFMAGLAIATALLHALGIAFAWWMNRVQAQGLVRVAGCACVLVGVGLLAAVS